MRRKGIIIFLIKTSAADFPFFLQSENASQELFKRGAVILQVFVFLSGRWINYPFYCAFSLFTFGLRPLSLSLENMWVRCGQP